MTAIHARVSMKAHSLLTHLVSIMRACTLKFHVSSLLDKLDATGRTDAVAARGPARRDSSVNESERRLQSGIECAWPCRTDRTGVGKRRTAVGEIGHIGGVEEVAVSRIAVVKDVVDAAVDLEGLIDLVGSVDIGHGIGR
jgi:hypothetical protein